MKFIKKFFLFSFYFLVLLEFFSFIFTKLNLLYVNNDPDYIYSYGNSWRTENTSWGSWHKINYKDKHSSNCFSVNYKSNNIGARDDVDYNYEQIEDSILLIGDSLAEGFALNIQDTFHKNLEKKINKKILNFGSAGNFGTVQAFILYKNLASKFNHSEIIYFFNPASDFIDNDWEYWKLKIRKFRKRPYFIKEHLTNDYKIFYPNNLNPNFLDPFKEFIFLKVQPFLLKYTYSSNTLRTINYLYSLKSKNLENKEQKKILESLNNSYFNKNLHATEGTITFIEKFLKQAKEKKITILIIPHISDLELVSLGKNYKDLTWYKKIRKISEDNNVNLIDMVDYLDYKSYKKMIHSCDDHWNRNGSKFASDLVFKLISSK